MLVFLTLAVFYKWDKRSRPRQLVTGAVGG